MTSFEFIIENNIYIYKQNHIHCTSCGWVVNYITIQKGFYFRTRDHIQLGNRYIISEAAIR